MCYNGPPMFWQRTWALIVTQFFGAFGDNALKLYVTLYIFKNVPEFATEEKKQGLTALINALAIAPFILLSPFAGRFADKFSKRSLSVWTQPLEAAAIAVALLAFAGPFNYVFLLLAVVFMWVQSALFSPAKYGILPELVDAKDLSKLNGIIEMTTMIGIILGNAAAGVLFLMPPPHAILVLMGMSLTAFVVAFGIPRVSAAAPERSLAVNPFAEVWRNLRILARDRVLLKLALGIAAFYFFGQLFLLNTPIYAQVWLGMTETQIPVLLALVSLGIGIGSLLAGWLSFGGIEIGFVPVGAVGMGVCSVMTALFGTSSDPAAGWLFLLGLFAGIFLVPLFAWYQKRSPETDRGSLIATLNIITFTAILAAALSMKGFALLGVTSRQVYWIAGAAIIILAVVQVIMLPEFLIRLGIYILTHTIYRLRVLHGDRVPEKGGVILASNHVSLVDALLLMAAIPRPIRFLMDEGFYRHWFLHPFCKAVGAVPIGPGRIRQALDRAAELARQGEVVAVFPEGEMTRTGHLLPFRRGIEKIAAETNCPILPVHLDRVWGSIFSYERGKFVWKLPRRLPYPVTITVGHPLPSVTSAWQVRQRVAELGSEGFGERLRDVRNLPYEFVKRAWKWFFRFAMADSTGVRLTFGGLLIRSCALARFIRRTWPDETIGVLLPSSVGGSVVNIALALAGKTAVNLNFTASKEAIESAIRQCGLRTILTARAFVQKLGWPERPEFVYLEDVKGRITPGDRLAFLWMRGRKIDQHSVVTVMFSSGSTGDPKGVMLTHANILSNVLGCVQVIPLERRDRVMGVLPLFHAMGYTVTVWMPVLTGLPVVYHPNPLDARRVGELARQYGVTLLVGTPTFLQVYTRRCEREEFASLRFVLAGAEKLSEAVAKAFEEKFGVMPREGYGCTEMSPVVSVNVPDFIERPFRQIGTKPGSVGHPLPGVVAKVVDPDTGQDLPADTPGLLLVKGCNQMKGYLGKPEETARVLRDGWYVTGDMARIDEDGFIFITDRLARFSKIGGEMVPHMRIEEALERAAGPAPERRFVVTGVPDPERGERLAVLYVGDPPVDRLIEALREELPPLWVPRKDSFVPVESFPLAGPGKVDLRAARALAQQRLQAGAGRP